MCIFVELIDSLRFDDNPGAMASEWEVATSIPAKGHFRFGRG